MKRFGAAKQRLLDSLDRPQRAALARAMLADVLEAVVSCQEVERTIVVTGERRAERIALDASRSSGAPLEVLRDPHDSGHPEAATLGIVRAKALGASCCALLPGDCPLLDPGELGEALARMASGTVVVIPDRHGSGTNGLLLAPPDAIRPGFGPGSRERHEERARAAGHEVSVQPLESLALDVDTPEDLAAIAELLEREPGRARHTAAALAEIAPAARA